MNVELQEFSIKEIDHYVTLFLSVYEKDQWNDSSFKNTKHYLLSIVNTPGFRGYIAYKNSMIVAVMLGFIIKRGRSDEYFVKEFFIDPVSQDEGMGSLLNNYMIEILKQENVDKVLLLTEKMIPEYEFYIKNGYKMSEDTVFMYQNIKKEI